MPHPAPEAGRGRSPSARRRLLAPMLALLVLAVFGGFLLLLHRANTRKVGELAAELARKEHQLRELVATTTPLPAEALEQELADASEVEGVLSGSERQRRRLSELLDHVGSRLPAGLHLRSLNVGRERLRLAGCVAGPQVLAELEASLRRFPYLELEASAPAGAEAQAACAGTGLEHAFERAWTIRGAEAPSAPGPPPAAGVAPR